MFQTSVGAEKLLKKCVPHFGNTRQKSTFCCALIASSGYVTIYVGTVVVERRYLLQRDFSVRAFLHSFRHATCVQQEMSCDTEPMKMILTQILSGKLEYFQFAARRMSHAM